VEILAEKSGLSFNYDEALNTWANGLAGFYNYPITLKQVATEPTIKKTEVSGLIKPLQDLFNQSSTPEYFYADKKWSISKKSLAGLIKFEKNDPVFRLSVDRDNFDKWFKLNIGDQINIPAQNATIEMKNGQMTGLSTQRNGQEADQAKAYSDLNNKITASDFNNLRFELVVKTTTPEVAVENINNLGIKEIIGTGQSNFAGSPTNRRKNIRNGANKLHGLLIKPDEEFSLIKTLLPVDASTGYFPEL
jgi:vancomycin resistance protein YoaR